jgi:hypothetical protein
MKNAIVLMLLMLVGCSTQPGQPETDSSVVRVGDVTVTVTADPTMTVEAMLDSGHGGTTNCDPLFAPGDHGGDSGVEKQTNDLMEIFNPKGVVRQCGWYCRGETYCCFDYDRYGCCCYNPTTCRCNL